MVDEHAIIRIDLAIYVKPNGLARIRATYPEAQVFDDDEHGVLYVSSSDIDSEVWVRANPKAVGTRQSQKQFREGKVL